MTHGACGPAADTRYGICASTGRTDVCQQPNLKVVDLDEDKAQLSLSILKSRDIMSSLAMLVLCVRDREAALQLDQDREASVSEMMLDGCAFFFPSSLSQPTTGIWKWFGQLVDLCISSCDVLIYWPEEEFLCLVALKNLRIERCSKLIGPNRARDQLLPHLTSLRIVDCVSLTELFVLPTSLKDISIFNCDELEFIWGKEDAALGSDLAASTSIPEQSPAAPRNHSLPCLESLDISRCASFVTLQNLPASLEWLRIYNCPKLRSVSGQLDSLKYLDVRGCNKLESLDCLGDLPSLDDLCLERCKCLSSVPGVLGSYSLLRNLRIEYCPALNMKPLYERHRQRLDSLERRDLSRAHSSDPSEALGFKLRDPRSWCRRAIQADDD